MAKIKLRVLNKFFCERHERGQRTVVPNPFELAKQRCIMEAGKVAVDLPYFPYGCYEYEDDYPQLTQWLEALTRRNPPDDTKYRANPARMRELLEPLDFSKPFDAAAAAAIWEEFRATPQGRALIDADDIVDRELAAE